MKITETNNMGGHLSTANGLDQTPKKAKEFGFKSFQIFTKNQMQWKAKPLDTTMVENFRNEKVANGNPTVMVHASYLLNTASSDPELRKKVEEAFKIEIERADMLNIELITFHPGSFKEADLETGIKNVIDMLNNVMDTKQKVKVLLENSAGQGNSVGKTFKDLGKIIDGVDLKNKVGVTIDTCHTWASGYNFSKEDSYSTMIDEIKSTVGIEKILGFHFNDSKKGLGEHTDRHEMIGKGTIGVEGFRYFIEDKNFKKIPMIFETPKGEEGYMEDLKALNKLVE
jgi:deoxyribonuclease-4